MGLCLSLCVSVSLCLVLLPGDTVFGIPDVLGYIVPHERLVPYPGDPISTYMYIYM